MGKSVAGAAPEEAADELTDWEARRKRLYKEAFREVMVEFGLDPVEPIEIQQDMAWVRRRRKMEESNFVKVVGLIIGAIVTGAIGAVAYAIQRYFGHG